MGLHIFRDSPWWYLIKVRDVTVKKISMKNFCIIKDKIAYMECVIQSSMFYSFYLFLSILLCNVDSALVSDLNAYISNFELYSNVRVYIWDFFTSTPVLFKSWNFVFYWEEGGCLCWAWRSARGVSCTNVTKRDGGVGRWVKKVIFAWRNYWMAPYSSEH